jgi:S-(hydroxymethyl)glutathione dehydrogenase/alcohol dehydrogenase
VKTRAALIREVGKPFEIVELDLDGPKTGEVVVRFAAAGLCHSDDHVRTGDAPVRYPIVGGHEGAGIVEEVGAGVTRLAAGDHVVASWMPACGHCRFCARGQTNVCDLGRFFVDNCLPDGTFRLHEGGKDVGQFCLLGTFSQYGVLSEASVMRIDDDVPFEVAALLSCGVPTGFGTAVNAGEVRPGDVTIVYGIGGVGANALQGAAYAGARYVIAVDPVEFKRTSALTFGATHAVATAAEAHELALSLTNGVGADQALVTVGLMTEEAVSAALAAVRKRGTVVLTGLAGPANKNVHIAGFELTLFEKRLQGAVFGSCNPFDDIPRLLDLYRAGKLKLKELITSRYTLDQVNNGYEDMRAGRNIRGMIIHL